MPSTPRTLVFRPMSQASNPPPAPTLRSATTRRTLHQGLHSQTSLCENSTHLWIEKSHNDPARLEREWHALVQWAPYVGRSPAVLDVSREDGWLHLEYLYGHPPEGHLDAWKQAGEWLRRLHQLPRADTDPKPLTDAWRQRVQSVFKRARNEVDGSVFTKLANLIGSPSSLATTPSRVPCHRDFTPNNWIWNSDENTLAVIDFEHSRMDDPISDLVKLEGEYFPEMPEQRIAFYNGYGACPDNRVLVQHLALHALATLTWGLRNRDADFLALGQRLVGIVDAHTSS